MGLPDKRLAIENHANDEAVNYGLLEDGYYTVKTVNLGVSSNPNSRVFRLGVRVYPLAHSRNILGIDFKLISPKGEHCIITAGSMSAKFIRWADLALTLVPIFYPYEMGDYSMILNTQLGDILRGLTTTIRRNTQPIPISNKAKLDKSKKSRYLKKITK